MSEQTSSESISKSQSVVKGDRKKRIAKIFISLTVGVIFIIIIIISPSFFWYIQTHKCPESCDDNNICTKDFCSPETNYKCQNAFLNDCCGNARCEAKEDYKTCPTDCPNCNDDNKCTKDSYDYHTQQCLNTPILDEICCGNGVCETGEVYQNCARDCPNCNDDNKCTKDSYDYYLKKCLNEIIIPCCGNKICDENVERPSNCSTDCPNCNDGSKLTLDSFNYKTQKCEYVATHYFLEDFEGGSQNWSFFGDQGPTATAWITTAVDGNTVLKGTGHNWANLDGKEWTDYIFKTKFKIIQEGDGIHFNYRNKMAGGNPTRYFIGVGSNRLSLTKQINEKFFNLTDSGGLNLDLRSQGLDKGWHTFEIRGYGNILNLYIDNKLLIKYKDTDSPVLAGGIAFETLNNSEFLIDEVEVKVIAEKDIIYP